MAILYLETNFLMSIATDQDPEAADLLANPPLNARLVVSEGCFMEALSALEDKRPRRQSLTQLLEKEIYEWRRVRTPSHAGELRKTSEKAIIENTSLTREVDAKLFDAMRLLFQKAEIIGLTVATVDQSFRSEALLDDPTDTLILCGILEHARLQPSETKAFLSANTKDFGTEGVRQAIRDAGIEKYFSDAKNARGWLKSLTSPSASSSEKR